MAGEVEVTMGAVDAKGRPREVGRIRTGAGRQIFLIPVETFPGHVNNLFVIEGRSPSEWLLFDVGTARREAQEALDAGFEALGARFGVTLRAGDMTHVVISHAHVDHFGGLHRFCRPGVSLYIHELDARVLSNFSERIVVASRDVRVFFERAGLSSEDCDRLVAMYAWQKDRFESVEIEHRLRHGDVLLDDMDVIHVPGHCPGMIALRIDDVMLTADHVLSRITPTQMPQSITPFTGLETYLRSLERMYDLSDGVALGLGAHEAPIPKLRRRIIETVQHHETRLDEFLARLSTEEAQAKGMTIADIALAAWGEQKSYGQILALNEAGAHVEYLHQLGFLALTNLDEVASSTRAAWRYRARRPGAKVALIARAAARRRGEHVVDRA